MPLFFIKNKWFDNFSKIEPLFRYSYNFLKCEKARKSRSLGFFIHICKLLRLVGCDARINDFLNISV